MLNNLQTRVRKTRQTQLPIGEVAGKLRHSLVSASLSITRWMQPIGRRSRRQGVTSRLSINPANRSESIRQRRQQSLDHRLERSTRSQFSTPSAPPVLIRGGAMGIPLVNSSRSRVRRKFSISLGTRGAEMMMPAVPIVHPGWRLLSGFITLALGALIIFIYTSSMFQIQEFKAEGLKRLSASDVSSALKIKEENIVTIEPDVLEQEAARQFPELKDISISIALPGSVTLTATERKPVLAWRNKDIILWFDNEGVPFMERGEPGKIVTIHSESDPPLVSTQPEDLLAKEEAEENGEKVEEKPAEKGAVPINQVLDPALLKAALKLRKAVPAEAAIIYRPEDGFGWADPGGWNAYVGTDLSNLDDKLKVYKGIVKDLQKTGVAPAMISVEFVNAPFYRLE